MPREQSLRDFIRQVENFAPAEIVRIAQPVSSRIDITAAAFEAERAGRAPVMIFENVDGNPMPVVTNVAANRALLAMALGVDAAELPTAFRERSQRYIPAQRIDEAPWREIEVEGDAVDLTTLPIPFHFPVDGAPYITAGQIAARDPETGVDTTGFHRLMLKGPNRLGVSLHSRRRMWNAHRKAAERGENLPAAITLGIHPLHYMGSMVYNYPPGVRKFDIIGGLFGEPYEVARCAGADVDVPAGAEIVIEGEILADETEPEGPFGEFTGYASYRSTQNVFVAHRISRRADAMFHSVVSGMSSDHILISCVTREGEMLNTLRRNLPNVTAVHVPRITAGALMAVVQMRKTSEGEPQQAILAALGAEFYCKCVVVVDDDVDIFDLSDVMWAVATRARADRDLVFIPGAKGAILDPVSDPETFTLTKVGVDATRPKGRDFAERLSIPPEARERGLRILREAGMAL